MRTLALLLLAQASSAMALSPAEADTLVQRAHRAFAIGDVPGALALYDSVAVQYTSAGLEYDRANCHFRLGDLAKAVLHYERALRMDPTAEDARSNLELTRSQLVDRVEALPGMDLTTIWDRMGGMDRWARRAILFTWACVLLLIVALVPGRPRGWERSWGAAAGVAGMLAIIAITLSAVQWRRFTDRSEAILMEPRIQVKSAPTEQAKVLFVLHEGAKLKVLQVRNGSSEVELPNGLVGWVPSGALERI